MAMTVEQIANKVKALKPADRLRLAAELIDLGKYDHAEPVVRMVADELTAVRLMRGRTDG
jgi:hypothetical protein